MASAWIKEFPHRRAGHCGSGALRDLFAFHDLSYLAQPLSEDFVFGVSGAFGFTFIELPAHTPPLYLVGRTPALEQGVCRHLGIDLNFRQTEDWREGWNWLRDELDRGRPTMIWADIKHLDYLRARQHNTMHDVIAVGYDEAKGSAYLADSDRDEIQACSLESLRRARNSIAFPAPNLNATWFMDFPERLPPVSAAIDEGLRSAIANMRGENSAADRTPGRHGLSAINSFAAGFPAWPERFGGMLDEAVRALATFIVKAGTGGAMFRAPCRRAFSARPLGTKKIVPSAKPPRSTRGSPRLGPESGRSLPRRTRSRR